VSLPGYTDYREDCSREGAEITIDGPSVGSNAIAPHRLRQQSGARDGWASTPQLARPLPEQSYKLIIILQVYLPFMLLLKLARGASIVGRCNQQSVTRLKICFDSV
jgi:hypothetical protein